MQVSTKFIILSLFVASVSTIASPTIISDANNNSYQPNIAVTGDGDNVAVLWMRTSDNRVCQALSGDGGVNFTPSSVFIDGGPWYGQRASNLIYDSAKESVDSSHKKRL